MARIGHFLCLYLVATAPLVDTCRRLRLGKVRQALDTQEKTEAAAVQGANAEEAQLPKRLTLRRLQQLVKRPTRASRRNLTEVQVAETLVEKEQSLMEEESEGNGRASPLKVLAMLLAGFSNLTNAVPLPDARPVNVAGQRLAVKGPTPTMLIRPEIRQETMQWNDKVDENLVNIKVFDGKVQAEIRPEILQKTMQWIDKLDENTIKVFEGKVQAKIEGWFSQMLFKMRRGRGSLDRWTKFLTSLYNAAGKGDGVRGICEVIGVERDEDLIPFVPFLNAVMSTAQDMRKDAEKVDLVRDLAASVAEIRPEILQKTMQWIDNLDENKIKVFEGKVQAKIEDGSLDLATKVLSQMLCEGVVTKVLSFPRGSLDGWTIFLKSLYNAAGKGDGVRGIRDVIGVERDEDLIPFVPFLNAVMSTAQDMRKDADKVDLARELVASVAASKVR